MLPRDLVRNCGRNYPDKTAYLCGDRKATWAGMDRRSDRLGLALQRLSPAHRDGVAMLSPETIEIYEVFFACMKIGAPRIGVNTQYAWPEIHHVLRDSGARILIVAAQCVHLIADHRGELDDLGIVLVGFGGDHPFEHDLEILVARIPAGPASAAPEWPPLRPDDTLFISYTSGTTGFPKGAMLTQQGGVNCILHSLISFGFGPDDVWYMPAASAWVVVIMNVFGLGNGMAAVLPDGAFEVRAYLRDAERFGVTVALLPPTMLQRAIRELRENPAYDLAALRLVIYGSSPATPKLIRDAREAFRVPLLQTYAMTEATGGWISYLTEADHRRALGGEPELLRSVGRIGVHYECSIRDPAGQPVAVGETGEIWLRGNTLMKGYRNLPAATAETMPDGWLRTNDIGRLDQAGYLYLLDRQKFLIITGAVNVFPATVEAVLVEHPAVEEVAVVGAPHPEWGEAVVAIVVRKPDHADATAAEILTICRDRLSRPETPKHVVFLDALPKTSTSKVRKADLRQWLAAPDAPLPWREAAGGDGPGAPDGTA
jgi:acyl-CoA synthetase (AMP-forming)/AMP-acid ligase II